MLREGGSLKQTVRKNLLFPPVASDDPRSAAAWIGWGGFSSDEDLGTQAVRKYLVKRWFCVRSVCAFSFPF